MATIRQLPVFQHASAPVAAPPAPAAPTAVSRTDEGPVEGPDWGATRCLIAATAIAGLFGIPLGLHLAWWTLTGRMGELPWVGWAQAHGQVQLFGWLGLAVLGVTFHAMAHLFGTAETPGRVAWTVLVLQVAGVVFRFFAPIAVRGEAALAPGNAGAWLLLASALSFVGAFAVTLEAHIRTLPRRSGEGKAPRVLPRFLLVGLLLWLAALLVNLDGAIDALRFGFGSAAAAGSISAGRNSFIITASAGGMALVALGMSLRVVVGWLDLPPSDLRRAEQAWAPLALGTVLRAAAAAAGSLPMLEALAGITWAVGVAWYLPALSGLWTADAVRTGGGRRGDADPPLAWFVRTAYAWLIVAALLALAEAVAALAVLEGGLAWLTPGQLADAGRHALLFGFLGTLTAGLTGRLPTAFLEVDARGIEATRAWYRAAWLLIVPAAALRIAGPLAGESRSLVIAASGVLGTLALWALLVVLVKIALLARARTGGSGFPPDARAAAAV